MVAPLCTPEDACPGFGLGVTTSGGGLQILGATVVTYDADLHEAIMGDCALQAGQGQYLVPKSIRRIYTAAERAALAGANRFTGLEVFESDTLKEYTWDGAAWVETYDLNAFDAFTVQAKQTVNITSTTTRLTFVRRGRLITARGMLTITSAGTASTEVKLTPTGLPAPVAGPTEAMGSFKYRRAATFAKIGEAEWDGTDIRFMVHQDAASPLYLGASATVFQTVNGDTLSFGLTYEAAT